jgi:RNA polymerase sigma factor (sigma-70 family)
MIKRLLKIQPSTGQRVSAKMRSEFEHRILPHAPAAYSLARWLLRHPQDAEDALQDGILKALKAFHGYNGGNAEAWLLAIVRNTCLTLLERRRAEGKVVVLADVAQRQDNGQSGVPDPAPQQDAAIIAEEERRRIRSAVAALPLPFREVLVLREYHDLSYREIADIVGAPVGTVMSRLARARERLTATLSDQPVTLGNGTPS